MRQLVIGAGEVGIAIADVLATTWPTAVRDTDPTDDQADVLHVCFPWSPTLPTQVAEDSARHGARLVVVHTTVPTGTSDRQGWVFSPVRGRHPYLAEAVRRFTKQFGGHRAQEAADVFRACGLATTVRSRAAELEAGKLWELVQFGLQVRTMRAIRDWCVQEGLDFDIVYTEAARVYNAGYEAMGESRFTRPLLEYVPGPIGGHCVRENSRLLDHVLADEVAGDADTERNRIMSRKDINAETIASAEAWLDQLDPDTTPADDITDLRAVSGAANARDAAEQRVRDAVDAARDNGRSWARIGIALGVSKQAACERYGRPVHA